MDDVIHTSIAIQQKYGIESDLSKSTKMPHFWPENPYDLEINELYLYHLVEADWDPRISSHPPRGDYIVQFAGYRPDIMEYEKKNSRGKIISNAFRDKMCAWNQTTKLQIYKTRFNLINPNHIIAQCLVLFYRKDSRSHWKEYVEGFEWQPFVNSIGDELYLYLEIDVNNMQRNMVYCLRNIPRKSSISTREESHEGIAELIHMLKPMKGHMGIIDADLIEDLDEPPPGPPFLTRQISATLSNQLHESTCFAHTVSRMLLKAIRNYIPEWFGDLSVRSYCNNSYNVHMMKNISYHIGICNRIHRYQTGERYSKSGNNFLLFTYIYKSIINIAGCNGFSCDVLLDWFTDMWFTPNQSTFPDVVPNSSVYDKSSLDNIMRAFSERRHRKCLANDINITERDQKIISKMLRSFDNTFFSIPGNKMDTHVTQFYGSIPEKDQQFIKFSIDNNYYVGFSYIGKKINHIVTIVDYREINDSFIIIIKNSVDSIESEDRVFGGNYINQHLSINTNQINIVLGRLFFMLPESLMVQIRPDPESFTRTQLWFDPFEPIESPTTSIGEISANTTSSSTPPRYIEISPEVSNNSSPSLLRRPLFLPQSPVQSSPSLLRRPLFLPQSPVQSPPSLLRTPLFLPQSPVQSPPSRLTLGSTPPPISSEAKISKKGGTRHVSRKHKNKLFSGQRTTRRIH